MSAMAAEELTCRFGGLVAVGSVSLSLDVGTLHALIGPNGAGKSTLVNLLSGEMAPSAGRLLVNGRDATGWSPHRIARAGVGRSFQKTNVMRGLTVAENVRLSAQAMVPATTWLRPARPMRATDAALDRVGLPLARRGVVAATLSHGELRLLEIAMALATDPRVLLLDEPLAGMGPEDSERLAGLLRRLARDHAVLLVEHDMDVVFAVADLLTVMVDGRVIASGRPEVIRTDAAVREAYLGHDV